MANKADLKVGERISALRMSNKAIRLTGTLVQVNDDGKTVNMTMDGHDTHIETVHVDDVTVLDGSEAKAPAAGGAKSLTTVNGVAI